MDYTETRGGKHMYNTQGMFGHMHKGGWVEKCPKGGQGNAKTDLPVEVMPT